MTTALDVDPWLAERIDAELRITQAEQVLYDAWWGAYTTWLSAVKRSVLAGPAPDPHAVWAHAPLWQELMATFVAGPVTDIVGMGYAPIFGDTYPYAERPAVVAHLAAVTDRLRVVPDRVHTKLANLISAAANAGDTAAVILAAVTDTLTPTPPVRQPLGTLTAAAEEDLAALAATLPRTEAISALNAGRADAFTAVDQELGGGLQNMWLCVAADTPVVAAGAAQAARRHYKGPAVRLLTVSGRSLTVTPQHRVLTGRGWLPAEAVNLGDHLVQVVGIEPLRTPDVQDVPAKLGELVDAAMAAEPVKVRTVPAPVNLNGEAPDGQIQVVPVHRHLLTRLQSGIPKGHEDLFLTYADALGMVAVLRGRDSFPYLLPDRLAQQGGAGGRRPRDRSGERGTVTLRRADPAGRALVANLQARLQEKPVDGRARASVPFGDGADAASVQVGGGDRRPIDVVTAAGLNPKPLRCAGLLDGPGAQHALLSSGLPVEQDTLFGEPPPDRYRADRQRGGDLAGRLARPVAVDDDVEIQVERCGVVGRRVAASVAQDRHHALSAQPQSMGDGARPFTGSVKAAQHLGHKVVSAGAVLTRGGFVSEGDAGVDEALAEGAGRRLEVDGQVVHGGAGLVAPDQVVGVDVVSWDAHVYDLSTVSGWYAANGLIVHNSTLDGRTRPDHLEADGQRVAVDEPFVVGGETLMYPGDPAGSPAQTYNCRCTMILTEPGEDVDMSNRGWQDWEDELQEPGELLPAQFDSRAGRAAADGDALSAAPAGLGRTRTGLAQAQREALRDYQGTMYYGINRQLGVGQIERTFATRIRHIDAAMDVSRLDADALVYRGMRDGEEAFGTRYGGDLTGVTWTERRFLSTSATERVARDFTYEGASTQFNNPVVMRLIAPRGIGAVQLSGLGTGGQAELLLQRGLRLRVVQDRGVVGGVRRLDVEVMPATTASRKVAEVADKATTVPARAARFEIRESLLGGTADQVAAKFAAEWSRTTGRTIDVEVPAGASPQTVREHFEGLLRAAERFPFVRLERVDWENLADGVYAEASTVVGEGGSIQFSGAWLHSSSRAKYLRALSRDVESSFSPAGFTTPGAVAIHEFGHVLHLGTVDYLATTAKVKAALREYAESRRYGNPDGSVAQGLAARFGVSGYAATNVDELVAEAFGDVMVNGLKASALSRQIFNILEEAYREAESAAVGRSAVRRSAAKQAGTPAARAGDISRDHTTMAAIYRASVDEDGSWLESTTGDQALIGVARHQGFDARPTVLSNDDFDRAVADRGHPVMYRGVNPESFWGEDKWQKISGADVHAALREGAYQPGYGVFGNGYYFATDRLKAESFSDGKPGSLGRYALSVDARVIDYEDLNRQYGEWFDSDWASASLEVQGVTGDFGRYAASLGYDAIRVPVGTKIRGGGTVQREEWVVLNRGALITDSGS